MVISGARIGLTLSMLPILKWANCSTPNNYKPTILQGIEEIAITA